MADQTVFGVFKEEKCLIVSGEPYDKPVTPNPRYQGRQFVVSDTNAISGHGKETWFDQGLLLATPSSSYMEPLDLPVIVAARAGPGAGTTPGSGNPLHDKAFRPSNPAQRSGRGAGSLYGTFGPSSILLTTSSSFTKSDRGSHGDGSRRPSPDPTSKGLGNIYARNTKRGGPGYPDQYRVLSGQTYTYVPDEYQRGHALTKVLKQEARARIPRPFWGGARANGTFTPDSELYATSPSRPPPHRSRSADADLPAWRPTDPPARGPNTAFMKPTYVPCPEPREQVLVPGDQVQLKLRPSTYLPATPPFAPTSAGHKRLSVWSVNPYERVPPLRTQSFSSSQPPPAVQALQAKAAAKGTAAAPAR